MSLELDGNVFTLQFRLQDTDYANSSKAVRVGGGLMRSDIAAVGEPGFDPVKYALSIGIDSPQRLKVIAGDEVGNLRANITPVQDAIGNVITERAISHYGLPMLEVDFDTVKIGKALRLTDAANIPKVDFGFGYAAASINLLFNLQRVLKQIIANNTSKKGENICPYSSNLGHASWAKSAVTVTDNAVDDPDGGTDADKITPNNANAEHYVERTLSYASNQVFNWSTVARADGYSRIRLHLDKDGTDFYSVLFDLDLGTVVSSDHGGTSSQFANAIRYIGKGYYRVSIKCLLSTVSGTTVRARLFVNDYGTFVGDIAKSVDVYGTQLSRGANLGPLIQTTNAAITVNNTALDSDELAIINKDIDDVLSPSSSLDIARIPHNFPEAYGNIANLLDKSEDFADALWTKSNVTVASNDFLAPNGTKTADKLLDTSGVADAYIRQQMDISNPLDDNYQCFSVFLHRGNTQYTRIAISFLTVGTTVTVSDTIDWDTLEFLDGFGKLLESAGDGWYRFYVACRNNASGNTKVLASIRPAGQVSGFTDVGYVYAWGAMVNTGRVPEFYYST